MRIAGPAAIAAMKRTSAAQASSDSAKKAKDASSEDDEMVLPTQAPVSANGDAKPTKPTQKLASIFQPRTTASSSTSSSATTLKWLDPIGPAQTCLHGVYGDPAPNSKVAFFDLDGTLVRPKGGKTFPSKTDEYDYQFLYPSTNPSVISRIRTLHNDYNFAIVIVTNQKQSAYSSKTGLATWKKKMAHIAAALDVPLRVFAALGDDVYRKPRLGIWDEFTSNWNGAVDVDREVSFYVGDAAGRRGRGDHGDTDLKWALNARVGFYTPEEWFLAKGKEYEIPMRPWSPSALPRADPGLKGLVEQPEEEMPTVDLAKLDKDGQARSLLLGEGKKNPGEAEIVLIVGAPASGKTNLYTTIFAPAGYVHVNQDTLRTRDKCLRVVSDSISSGESCVVDNTNRDKATRKHYVELAKGLGVGIRCVYFDVPKAVCVHNNHFRAFHGPTRMDEQKRGVLPYTAIESFFKERQVPNTQEGFGEGGVVRVKWGWSGEEAVKQKYSMYYH